MPDFDGDIPFDRNSPDFLKALAMQNGMEYIDAIPELPSDVIALLDPQNAREWRSIPIHREAAKVTFAVSDPINWEVIDSISFIAGAPGSKIDFVLVSSTEIEIALDRYYGKNDV